MKLIALLIGLAVERLATQLFHLRRLRWLDGVMDSGFRFAARTPALPSVAAVILLAVALVIPVFATLYALGDNLLGFPYLFVAIVVLFFSLGPKDIAEQVDEYCAALEQGEHEAMRRTAKALVERDVADDLGDRIREVEAAVCVQANNRLFAVIFWFVVLGPLGAWGYRVTDLIRRRAVFNVARDGDAAENSRAILSAAIDVHGWLAWVPARLTAVGYALAGSFDAAISAWREPVDHEPARPSESSERLLARVGLAALALAPIDGEATADRGVRGAMAANGLVFRLLAIWAVVIGIMTLYGASL